MLEEVQLAQIARPVLRPVPVIPGQAYRTIGVKWWGEGAYERQTIDGSQTTAKTLSLVCKDDLIINKIWVRHGSTAIAGEDVDGCAASGEFPTYELNKDRVIPKWLDWLTKTRQFWEKCDRLSRGTSGKNRIRPEAFLTITVPLPSLDEQRRIVARIEDLAAKVEEARRFRRQAIGAEKALAGAAPGQIFSALCADYRCQPLGITFAFRNDLIRPNDGTTGTVRFVGLQHIESHTGKKIGEDRLDVVALGGRKFRFSPGEIVYGYLRPYLNKVWMADCEGVCSVDQYVIRPKEGLIDPDYLVHFMRSPAFLTRAVKLTHNLMLPRLRSGLLESIPIPLPPLVHQRRAVARLNDLQAKVGAVRRMQAETAAELDALVPAILNRAFQGGL